MAVRAMRAGAVDFIEKPYTAQRLVAALQDARERTAFSLRAADMIKCLTPREREVLNGLVDGKANKVIAGDLGISPRTVEIYRSAIMEKLQARSFAEVVRIALATRLPT